MLSSIFIFISYSRSIKAEHVYELEIKNIEPQSDASKDSNLNRDVHDTVPHSKDSVPVHLSQVEADLGTSNLKFNYDGALETNKPEAKHGPAVLIPIEDAVHLLEEQRKRQEVRTSILYILSQT